MAKKVLKGQAWIFDNKSLVQDQVIIDTNGTTTDNVDVLIDDIWVDLTSDSGTYKTNNKGYFYWEYKFTSLDDSTIEETIFFECPKPKPGLYKEPYDPGDASVKGEYSKYWVRKLKEFSENAEKQTKLMSDEITLKGNSYYNQKGELVTLPDVTVTREDDSLTTGFLTQLFND